MENENKVATPENATDTTAQDYINAIKELKETTVSKELYDKKVQENKQLLDTLVQGGSISPETAEEAKKTSADYAKELAKPHTNLEYAKISLKHREACIQEGHPDPYMPSGMNFRDGRPEDAGDAEAVAEMLQSCIDDCDDNPDVFLSLYQARTVDLPMAKMKKSLRR